MIERDPTNQASLSEEIFAVFSSVSEPVPAIKAEDQVGLYPHTRVNRLALMDAKRARLQELILLEFAELAIFLTAEEIPVDNPFGWLLLDKSEVVKTPTYESDYAHRESDLKIIGYVSERHERLKVLEPSGNIINVGDGRIIDRGEFWLFNLWSVDADTNLKEHEAIGRWHNWILDYGVKKLIQRSAQ